MDYYSVNEIHGIVPSQTLEEIKNKYKLKYSDPELQLLYIKNMLMRGKIEEAKEYIETLHPDLVRKVMNTTSYYTYYGTILHTLLYWNNDEEAVKFYKLLINLGAKPIHDYYEQYPWEQDGSLYVFNESDDEYERDNEEFKWIYSQIKEIEKNNN